MAVDSARLLSEVSKSISTIQTTLENKILNGFIGADPTKISATAIKNLKNSVKISSGITGSSTKNVPNDVFTAFATMVSNDLAGSKIKKFETNDVKRTSQIASALNSGIKNEKKSVSVNGTNYSIEYNIIAYSGIGVSSAHVRWKDKNKKNQHIILTWTNVGTQQGNQAIAEYGSLLKDLDADLWKDFFKEILKPGAKTWIVSNYGEQILNSITDKVYAKNFLEDLGFYNKDIKAEKFGQFISDNVAGGDVIVSSAKLLKTLEKKQTALINEVNKNKNNNKKIESKLKDFAKTCNQLETKLGLPKSNFSIGEFTFFDIINKEKNITLSGTARNDNISNWGEKVTIKSGKGNDSINNHYSGENVKIFGENGNDYIYNFGENVTIYGGNSNDSIGNYDYVNYVKIFGNNGNDTIYNAGYYVTTFGGNGNDSILNNFGDYGTISGGNGNDSIQNDFGHFVTISGGKNNDSVKNYYGKEIMISGDEGDDSIYTEWGQYLTILGGTGNDSIFNHNADDVTITGGKGKDYISLSSTSYGNLIQYASGDGNDTIYGFNYSDILQITKGNYKISTKNNDVIVKVGTGKIILKDAVGEEISIQDSKGKVTTKIYGSSTSALLVENNFATADNLSEIVKNNLTPISLEKIETNNFENLTSENNLITFSEK